MLTSVWITRSRPGAQRLAAELADYDIEILLEPLIEIEPSHLWRSTVQQGQQPIMVVVTSQHAAQAYLESELIGQTRQLPHVVLGTATGDVLRAAELGVVQTATQSSEGALMHPDLQRLEGGQVVWIVAGEGGRDVLQEGLTQRGVNAVKLALYRRQVVIPEMPQRLPDIVEVSSLTALQQLTKIWPTWSSSQASSEPAITWPVLIVASKRIEQAAQDLGLANVVRSCGAEAHSMQKAIVSTALGVRGEGQQ